MNDKEHLWCEFSAEIKSEDEYFMASIKGRYFRRILDAPYFVCIIWFSIIGDRPFIASDKCTQKYAHCIVLCGLRTSGLYNK